MENHICSACIGDEWSQIHAVIGKFKIDDCCYCSSKNEGMKGVNYADYFKLIKQTLENNFKLCPPPYSANKNRNRKADQGIPTSNGFPLISLLQDDFEIKCEELINDLILEIVDDIPYDSLYDLAEINDAELLGEKLEFEECDWEASSLLQRWFDFSDSLHESHFFNHELEAYFERLLDAYDKVISFENFFHTKIGLGTEVESLWRARTFIDDESVGKAIINPALEMGPPPHHLATANRMNVAHNPVFYGATNKNVAIAEVRPPVGARVVLAEFRINTQLRLFDLGIISKLNKPTNQFDLKLSQMKSYIAFFQHLAQIISKPVLPGKETSDYLMTQAFCETVQKNNYAGIAFKSAQISKSKDVTDDRNIVLFNPSAKRIEPPKPWLPGGTKAVKNNRQILIHVQVKTDDDDWDHEMYDDDVNFNLFPIEEGYVLSVITETISVVSIVAAKFETELVNFCRYENEKPYHEVEYSPWNILGFPMPPDEFEG